MHQRRTFKRRGLGRTEVIVIVVVAVVVVVIGCVGAGFIGLMLPALGKARSNAMSLKDKAQMKQIHQASVVLGIEFGGDLPTPGLIAASLPSPDGSEAYDITEDYALNTSANFYSMLVMMNYVSPDLLVGPTEVNPIITVKSDYDWDVYDPASGVMWDESFTMELEDPSIGANGSYAHLAWVGDRRDRWAVSSSLTPVFGTRGTRGGATDGPEYVRSPILRLHASRREWIGNLVFNDGHTEVTNSFVLPMLTFDDGSGIARPDNIFATEFNHENGNQTAGDAFIGIFTEAGEFTLKDVYDLLDD